MAEHAFRLPDIGEGIAEAEIVAWHVAVGDHVEEDAPLVDMMTDKATVEISAPVSGRVVEVAGEIGDQIAIGSVLALLQTTPRDMVEPAAAAMKAVPAAEVRRMPELATVAPEGATAPAGSPAEHGRRRVAASPAVRKRASELGIDLADVEASGERIRHSDLDAFLSYNAAFRATGGRRPDETIRVVGLRRRIAENMAAAKRHIPHFTYVEEVDVTKLEALREDLNTHRGERPKLTVLPLLISAVCKAVVDFPMINARFDDEAGIITRSGAVHLGIATQTERGLMVPVIRDAQDRNVWQLAGEARRIAEAARSGTTSAAEMSGSTLTITSLGLLGGVVTTPVINRPEVAIIGPNRVMERPVFRNGNVEAAKLMNFSVSCDHRVVDGWDAASFVQRLKSLLETPAILFAP